ncbi:GspE/PulE family protein [Desulfurivibrio dismutans]|uniref:GspE/PulE family protein n=1 Tax=Desulfurivibrio dismutans TaxID=1398908 RepID=UPI0023D99EB1|nr:GspE/PulE family protein [Desulfurivibrio alkaliphilus]MDF1615692.1 GspE/PulE family protein [Desulfurivibrio alkaliphilus]
MRYLQDAALLADLLYDRRLLNQQQVHLFREQVESRLQNLRKAGGGRQQRPGPGNAGRPDLLDALLAFRFETGDKPGELLSEEQVTRAVAEAAGLPFKKLDPLDLDLAVVTKTIPRGFAVKHLILPLAVKNGVLEVAIHDPDHRGVLAEIERAVQMTVRPHLATRSDILRMLQEFFNFQSSISAAEDNLAGPGVDLGNLEQYVKVASSDEAASTDHHITTAVDHLFNYAFEQRASDIHIEPKRECSQVRLRIDGALHTVYQLPKVVHAAVVSRIKSLSRLNIAEKRRPQDGRIKIDRSGQEAEIRVSTIPVAFGEKAVLRILDPEVMFQNLQESGFSPRDYRCYQQMIHAPHGMILITGPTGSGKSTTLYSTLKEIASPEINIVTIEDPVEMVHEEFNQIAVQPQTGVTFASVLRNILRQDPDVIMVGEIRDHETATNAIQAALTGHLVFSTLHTNDAVSSLTRLVDLGIQPFLAVSTLLGIMAQRLVRRICPHCTESYQMPAAELRALGLPVAEEEGDELTLRRGKGCRACRNTGYLGRCGIFEVFTVSEEIRRLIAAQAPEDEIRARARQEGMLTLREDAWSKVKSGITSLDDALRVTT